jgi:hypothetical protein
MGGKSMGGISFRCCNINMAMVIYSRTEGNEKIKR